MPWNPGTVVTGMVPWVVGLEPLALTVVAVFATPVTGLVVAGGDALAVVAVPAATMDVVVLSAAGTVDADVSKLLDVVELSALTSALPAGAAFLLELPHAPTT